MAMTAPPTVRTRFFILSDTHGHPLQAPLPPDQGIDVSVHCGDLTEHSTLAEFRETVELLRELDAPLKLVIAGNHDLTLDPPVFRRKLAEARGISQAYSDDALVEREFGAEGEARRLMDEAQAAGVVLLDEGTHNFVLGNGARLKVFASPYTRPPRGVEWAFQYHGSHRFDIGPDTDLVVTHGPPRGVMDKAMDREHIECPQLLAAVARAQPRLHCFGHVHSGDEVPLGEGLTLMVNAAVMSEGRRPCQSPWLVDVELARAGGAAISVKEDVERHGIGSPRAEVAFG